MNTLFKEKIILRQPDDWHLHLRDGKLMESVILSTAKVFRRAVIMPNLSPPITSISKAIEYKKRIIKALPKEIPFQPLMTVYLTDETTPELLKQGFDQGIFFAAKLYPQNATTNSAYGVSDIRKLNSVLETMEEIGLPLLIHGEVTDSDVDIFDREAVFIERHLDPLLKDFSNLKVVLEHITTDTAVQYVETSNARLAATITPHHLHINRNAMFLNGLRSDFYCLPVAKRERHRIALRRAATSGKECFFLGTDSAPHERSSKQSSCGCAGIFNAPNALESYAQAFDEEGAISKLEGFSSLFGPSFYGLDLNSRKVTLIKCKNKVCSKFPLQFVGSGAEYLIPFHAGEYLSWKISDKDNSDGSGGT